MRKGLLGYAETKQTLNQTVPLPPELQDVNGMGRPDDFEDILRQGAPFERAKVLSALDATAGTYWCEGLSS